MAGFLEEAVEAARERVREGGAVRPLAALRAAAALLPPAASLMAALHTPGTAVIAEVKRASPSRGALAEVPDPAALARAYVAGGAAAVSVLTEPRWFRGSLADLSAVARAVAVPVVRKDFLVDPWQLYEARVAGAAAALVIVAAVDDATLAALLAEAPTAGLELLVEVHDVAEARRLTVVAGDRPVVVGINARDLATLAVDPGRFATVRQALPPRAVTVAESGVSGPGDVVRLGGLGADAVLVGERVVTAPDPAVAVAELVAAGAALRKVDA